MNAKLQYAGFESQVKWGEHLVKFGGCNHCHTPKKMGPNGPGDDMSLMLSGQVYFSGILLLFSTLLNVFAAIANS